jgi:hypothetical protein
VSIIYCLPPCGSVPFYGDTIHLGTLILGPLGAYLAYRAMRRSSPGLELEDAQAANSYFADSFSEAADVRPIRHR